ncbi:MAG: aminotransferase class I/II-fold pyridoxal phosphate-dependent enzyme, partial [Gammaproteobacteria bacterium]|nr:aminotransferase class I/II-fold pyridoxal phosphate-dependent enzyme [Gammaproteobacteria bacterium]
MNPDLNRLQPYPFEKLADLKKGITPHSDNAHIALSIGEPKHQPPGFVLDKLTSSLATAGQYPLTKGSLELRKAIANWLVSRFKLDQNDINPETQVIPVNGTREALFAFAQAII